MPKLYTSPFWVPWGGCRSYMSSSGAVQSFSEKQGTEWNNSSPCFQRCGPYKLWTRLTCIESVRVIVFAGRAEAGQAIIRDFQNKSAVHHAIRWLQISMAADVAVVEIIHSLVERSVKSSIKGCSPPPHLFPPSTANHTWKHKSRHMEIICSDKWMYAVAFQTTPCFKDGTVIGGISVKLLLIPLGGGEGGTASTLVQYFVEMVSQTSLKAAAAPLHRRTLLSAWSNLAAALPHTWSSIQSSPTRSLFIRTDWK